MLTATKGLTVVESLAGGDDPPNSLDDKGLGWRVLIESVQTVIGIKYLRKIDAERAMAAIADFTDWTDADNVADEIQRRNRELVIAMTECLAW